MISTAGEFVKTQDYMLTSVASGIGKGPRSDLIGFQTGFAPAPNTYDVAKDASQNNAPRMK